MMSAHNYQVVCIIQIILSRIHNNNPSNRLGEWLDSDFIPENGNIFEFRKNFIAILFVIKNEP